MSDNVNEVIMDIPVGLSVELGRTQMQVRDIMGLAPGTVIELEKKSDEPVELYVNGRLIGKGEVVIVNDALGIKITEVMKQ